MDVGLEMHSRCGVVVAEYAEFGIFDATYGHVREQGQQVAWSALWILADETRRVCAGRAKGNRN